MFVYNIYIILWLQGCQEGVDPFERLPYSWSAFQSDDYGYTRMKVFNATHLYMEQVSDDQVMIMTPMMQWWGSSVLPVIIQDDEIYFVTCSSNGMNDYELSQLWQYTKESDNAPVGVENNRIDYHTCAYVGVTEWLHH